MRRFPVVKWFFAPLALILVAALPVISWDAGPKACVINACSGGVELSKSPIMVDGKDQKMRGNTHLYIAKNAVELLAKDPDPIAKEVAKAVNACSPNWEKGLWDADDAPLSETSGAHGTHFYNASIPDPIKAGYAVGPDGVFDRTEEIKKIPGKSMTGEPTRQVTYDGKVFNTTKRGTARDKAHDAVEKIGGADMKGRIAKLTSPVACTELGYAIHYMTDMTQPMHSSSFSAVQMSPGVKIVGNTVALHAAFEYYAPAVQGRFTSEKMKWDGRMKTMPSDDAFQDAAMRANEKAPGLWAVLTAKAAPTCKFSFGDGVDYNGYCFAGDPAVDKYIGVLLEDAFQSTAGYLYSVIAMPSQTVKSEKK